METNKILVVDDEVTICEVLAASLRDEGYVVKVAHSGEEALKVAEDFKPSIMLLDVWMPGTYDGLAVLEELQKKTFKTPWVIVMSGHGTIETAVKAVKLGAWDFIEKPLSMEKILIQIRNILIISSQEKEKEILLDQIRESFLIVGESAHTQQLKSLVLKLGQQNTAPYLITGEEGVGRSLIARNIHYVSDLASGSFVTINCQALPEGLHVLELWGGKDQDIASFNKRGAFETASGGTLYLKNINYLDEAAQQKLVNYLKENRTSDDPNFVRIVCSSSVNLFDLVKDKKFREDLVYRISSLSITVKPLRERPDDIEALVNYFSDDYCRKSGVPIKSFNEEALNLLKEHEWRGNVLELKNFIERALILASGDKALDVYDLRYAGLAPTEGDSFQGYGTFREARAQFEKEYLLAKIAEYNGNISKTSEAIGLERSYLHRKIKAYGIDVETTR